ncbi:hypothetical protein ACH9DO_07370 [Kocuria sp. M1N1S27]|uniref:hypothetical protein n=1 Tax=Kocuria kalidii TaxID=3376283 RepID=UPI0037B80559
MAAAAGENWWRRTLAIGFLSFGALGLVGCDDAGTGGADAPAGDAATDAIEDEATPDGEGPREGESPAEQN